MCLLLGQTRTFPQGNGNPVQLRVFGDEFYARYENPDGYTVVYDTGSGIAPADALHAAGGSDFARVWLVLLAVQLVVVLLLRQSAAIDTAGGFTHRSRARARSLFVHCQPRGLPAAC